MSSDNTLGKASVVEYYKIIDEIKCEGKFMGKNVKSYMKTINPDF
jgi:hypothetical protein